MLREHVGVLHAASCELFGRPYRPDLKALEERLQAERLREHYPDGVSSFVRLELFASGEEICYGAGVSLYAGYAVRSLRPTAMTVAYDLPVEAPTTASESAWLVAQRRARTAGYDEAVRVDRNGVLVALGEGSICAFREGILLLPVVLRTATDVLVKEAAEHAGIRYLQHPIRKSEMHLCDEIFVADHYGLTSLSRLDDKPLMSLRVERLAEAMERLAAQRS